MRQKRTTSRSSFKRAPGVSRHINAQNHEEMVWWCRFWVDAFLVYVCLCLSDWEGNLRSGSQSTNRCNVCNCFQLSGPLTSCLGISRAPRALLFRFQRGWVFNRFLWYHTTYQQGEMLWLSSLETVTGVWSSAIKVKDPWMNSSLLVSPRTSEWWWIHYPGKYGRPSSRTFQGQYVLTKAHHHYCGSHSRPN